VGPVTSAPVAVMVRLNEIEVEKRPVPEPGPGQVLVEVSAVGVCGSDVHWFTEGRIGELVVDGPLVLGHEAAGVVRKLGPGVSRLSIGQRVALEPGVPCRRCRACRSGQYNLCPDIRFFATPPIDGAFARYVVHDEDFAYPLPDHVSDDAGALLEPLSVGIWATWKAGIGVGDRVLVTGAGPIGLVATAVARAAGAVEVVVTDTQPARLPLAKKMGATSVVDVSGTAGAGPAQHGLGTSDPASGGRGPLAGLEADVLIECSGAAVALESGLRGLRGGARAVVVGMSSEIHTPLPLSLVQRKEIELTGTFRYANTYPAAIALASSGEVQLDELVTGHYGLDQVEAALLAGRRDPLAVKPVVLPGR
jgi:L-iditol 2-dehydrogenase